MYDFTKSICENGLECTGLFTSLKTCSEDKNPKYRDSVPRAPFLGVLLSTLHRQTPGLLCLVMR